MAQPTNDDMNDRILDAATELFQGGGFQGATADEISDSAGITKRTLYRRMHDKETILYRVHTRFLDDLRTAMARVSSSGEAHPLAEVASVHLRTIAENQGAIRVFYEEMKHLSESNLKEIVAQRQEYWDLVADIIRREVAAGTFREVDVTLATHTFLGALNGTYRWYRPTGTSTPAQIADRAATLFMQGIATNPVRVNGGEVERASTSGASAAAGAIDSGDRSPMDVIEQAATELFSRSGYLGTTTRELADATGMTKAAVYYYIGSKDKLLFQIIDQMNKEGVAVVSEAIQGASNHSQALIRAAEAHVSMLAARRDAVTVFNEDYKHLNPTQRHSLTADRDTFTGLWESVLDHGVTAGEFRPGDNRVRVLLLMGSLNMLNLWFDGAGRLSPAATGAGIADLVLNGMAAPTK